MRAAELEPLVEPTADLRLGHGPPELEPLDQKYLMKFVRRVLMHRLRELPDYAPAYVPEAVAGLTCRVAVTLRREGRVLGADESDALPALDACRLAALAALDKAGKDEPITPPDLLKFNIELELIGPRERVGDGNDSDVQLALSFEPAIHGIAVRCDGNEILVRPSQLISREVICEEHGEAEHRCDRYAFTIEQLQHKLGVDRDPPERDPARVVFCRFRSMHLYEPEPGGDPVHLIAGMRLIPSDAVTHETVRDHVEQLAGFLRYRQNSNGFFAYDYLPGRDVYWPDDENWVRQAATAWAMAVHASQAGDARSAESAERAIAAFAELAKPLEDDRHAHFIATPDGEHPLGTTALVCLALLDSPQRERHADLCAFLMNGIAAMQNADGSFRTNFPPAEPRASQDYYPGEALLAIAKYYTLTRDGHWRDIADKALPFYRSYFRATRPAAFAPWQTQAWGAMARTTRLQAYADFAYEMTDMVIAAQLDIGEPPLSLYSGGVDVYGNGRPAISSAVYLEGVVEAARTAAELGDEDRAARYRDAARRAARLVVQLCFRKEELYYVTSPRDVLGGIRNTPINQALRIDNMQHALAALLGTLEVLPESTTAHEGSPSSAPRP